MAKTKKRPTSAKVVAGGAAGAIATLFWFLAVKFWWKDDFTPSEIAFVTGLTTTIVAAALGWLKSDGMKYLEYAIKDRQQADEPVVSPPETPGAAPAPAG
ncbi:MAG: hypothetical protein ACRDYU_06520 [Actinomycetes bacterium]